MAMAVVLTLVAVSLLLAGIAALIYFLVLPRLPARFIDILPIMPGRRLGNIRNSLEDLVARREAKKQAEEVEGPGDEVLEENGEETLLERVLPGGIVDRLTDFDPFTFSRRE